MVVIHIGNLDQYKKFKQETNKCIIFYGADECEACTEINNLYYRISKRYSDVIKMAYVDVEDLNLDYPVVPIFYGYVDGKKIGKTIGSDKKSLKNLVKKVIKF